MTRDPDSPLAQLEGCPRFVSSFIGYVEDSCPPEFKGARVEEILDVEKRGDLRRVELRIRLVVEESGRRAIRRLDDTVWLARFDGSWRVAKLSEIARSASLVMPSFSDAQ